MNLYRKFPPSAPCSCPVCTAYCQRPGWWTPEEAEKAIRAGYAHQMMLEIAPERTFYVLAPAFKGNEVQFALQLFSANGCTFLSNGLCELHTTRYQPLECRFCHHSRKGKGLLCHRAIEKEWKKNKAQRIILNWGKYTGFWEKIKVRINKS